jgi:hypothetical protein
VAERRRHRHRDDRISEPRRPAVHVQVPVGPVDGPLRAAVARSAARLACRQPARARRCALLDGGDAAGIGARRVCAPRRARRMAVGVAGRRRRRVPHRPARRARARHRLVARRARLSARDDRLGRDRVHLGRSAPGRRLDVARGVSAHGVLHGRCGGLFGARRAAARRRAEAGERRAQRRGRLSRRRRGGGARLRRHALRVRARGANADRADARRARLHRIARRALGRRASRRSSAA